MSAVYECEDGHKMLAHDERILHSLSCNAMVPFVLLHKTGFTTNFVNYCASLCQSGMNFHSLESVIVHRRWQHHLRKEQMYNFCMKHNSVGINDHFFPTFQEFGQKYLPSDDTISKCFLSKFIEDECAYISEIQSIIPGEVLSIDHTFKVASNIGYVRDDHRWVCQYNSAFIVFNGDGKIVTWQFTKGTGFEHIKSLLENIKHRQPESIKTVYVDNCCHWRRKIQDVLGSDVTVLLDVFHAVQRITCRIPKRHPFYAACVHDLRLVFRSLGDNGEQRSKPTPQPSKLVENINAFLARWKNVSHGGKYILTNETLAEIEKLKMHMLKGCLSGIPVGGGTNRNEAFHRYINTFFHKSRMGILLAYALMMSIICHFNSKEHGRKPMYKPVSLDSTTRDQSNLERMGITDSRNDLTWVQVEDENEYDHTLVDNILKVSLSQLKMYKTLKSQTNTATLLLKYAPYMHILSDGYFQSLLSPNLDDIEIHKARLKSNITAWNFDLIPVPPDGNCFFTSIALSLIQDINRFKSVLESIKVDVNNPISELTSRLRQIIVHEWLEHRHNYEGFLTNEIYEYEVSKFLQNGYYNSALGDTMPLAMATALNISIVILTSIPSSPVFFVSPPTTSELVLYLAFTSFGSGHYDALVLKSDVQPTRRVTKCRCGLTSNKVDYIACAHRDGRHSSCRCLAKGQSCSALCKCKNCTNPNGKKPVKTKRKRSRTLHKWQLVNTSNTSFAIEAGVLLAQGAWSDFENIVFANTMKHIESNMIESNTAMVSSLYHSIVKHINAPYCSIELPEGEMLRDKTTQQIAGKLNHYATEKALIEQ